jgi:glycosyltransferase involved in cell wall biosynthesis
MMKISIIVPAFNEEKLLPRSLAAIRKAASAFERNGIETELVVCDNNSTDRTAAVAREQGAIVAFEPINQISRARNGGARIATGDWLVFVDADSFPREKLFERVVQVIQSSRFIGGGCLVKLDEHRPFAMIIVALWNLVSRINKWAAGSFIFCEARAFREIGGFSTDLFVTEELDFSKRLKQYGRAHGKKMKIIANVKLETSARKMHLYKNSEHARFMLKALLSPRRVIATREECHVWYDGRR